MSTFPANHPDWTLLGRYFARQATPAESEAVEAWAEADEKHEAWLGSVRATWDVAGGAVPVCDPRAAERLWTDFQARAGLISPAFAITPRLAPRALHAPRSPFVGRPLASRALRLALPVALALGAVVWAVSLRRATPTTVASAESARTYATSRGERATVTLADGSRVQLAPSSRLSVASDFGGDTRTVTLDGEAVFTVVHAAQRPFVVRARNVTTQVLGTTFGVRAYADDPRVRVAVQDGRVAVNAVALAAGDVQEVSTSGELAPVRHGVDVAALLKWTGGTLTFTNTPLRDVAVQLSRWYGVDFVVGDTAVGRLPLTTALRTTDDVRTVIDIIAVTTGTKVERQGRTVLILTR